jgi:hypothetical protein
MDELLLALRGLFEYVGELDSSYDLRGSQYAWSWLLVGHVLSMCLFAGTIIMMDLRLLGVGNMHTPFSQVQRRLFPWQMAGMALSTVTGLALVYADPMRFFVNIIFWTKMVTMALAGLNALAFHFITEYSLVDWDARVMPPFRAKLAGGLSLVMWANVIVAGRLIPYNWFQ